MARPDAGTIALGGRTLFGPGADVAPHRRGIGYVFQEARLFPHRDVRANLLYGAPRGTDPGEVAAMLGIADLLDRRPGGLSGGEAARVAIGRALLRRPALLICDEPLAALDAARRARILPWLERMRDAGIPILYISHAIEEVARLADTLVLLRGGRVVRAGPLAEILADPEAAAAMGPAQAGSVLEGLVTEVGDGLSVVSTPAGLLTVAGEARVGGTLRVRVRAEDVIVATAPPEGLSALNVLPAVIDAVQEGQGPGVMLRLVVGEGALLARITRRSQAALGLGVGRRVWAVVKTSGVARADVGGGHFLWEGNDAQKIP